MGLGAPVFVDDPKFQTDNALRVLGRASGPSDHVTEAIKALHGAMTSNGAGDLASRVDAAKQRLGADFNGAVSEIVKIGREYDARLKDEPAPAIV